MLYKPRQLQEIMGIPKNTYATFVARKLLICEKQSHKSGMHSKFTKEEVLKNMLFFELTQCGLPARKSYELAKEADIDSDVAILMVGTMSMLYVNLLPMQEKIAEYNKET